MRGFPFILCAAITLAAGCTTTETRLGGNIIPPRADSPPPAFGAASQTSVSAVGVCTVAYDGFTLPLISPNGRWLATQTGVPPTWPTLLATKDQTSPMASAIEVWALDEKSGRRISVLRKGVILGRSADDSGFLVEEVLDDGSRRIGRVEWPASERSLLSASTPAAGKKDPEPEWIVDDGRVNAFACLSRDGRSIAWCSRDMRDDGFALSVRVGGRAFSPDGGSLDAAPTNWDLAPGPEQSWMMPVFGEDDREGPPTLFAMLFHDGITDLVAGTSGDAVAFEQSKVVRRLSVRMDERRTYQTLAPQGTSAAVGQGNDARLVLFDPDLRRMAIWDPRNDTFRPLAGGTFAACLAPDGSALAADRDGLLLDHADAAPGFPPRVYPRPAVPRHLRDSAASGTPHQWVLFVSDRKSISVVRFALIEASMAGG